MYNGKRNGKKKDYSHVSLDDFSDDDSDNGGFRDNIDDENNEADEYIRNQQVLMKMQDAGLDALSESVMRLGEMSNNISEELGQQNTMLEAMETDLDNAGEELDIVTRSTQQLIAQSGGKQTFCLIVALTMVIVILLIMLLYF